jgi:hypothetical protein
MKVLGKIRQKVIGRVPQNSEGSDAARHSSEGQEGILRAICRVNRSSRPGQDFDSGRSEDKVPGRSNKQREPVVIFKLSHEPRHRGLCCAERFRGCGERTEAGGKNKCAELGKSHRKILWLGKASMLL